MPIPATSNAAKELNTRGKQIGECQMCGRGPRALRRIMEQHIKASKVCASCIQFYQLTEVKEE